MSSFAFVCTWQAPSSLLEALEAHLANLEGRKVGSPTTPTGGAGLAPITVLFRLYF